MNANVPRHCSFDFDSYLANDMPAVERADFEQHLASCSHCRKGLEDLRLIIESIPAREVSVSELDTRRMRARVMARVQQPRSWRPALAASACAAIAMVALLSYPDSHTVPQGEQAELLSNLEMLQDFEMLQSLELLEELELLQDLENQG